MEPSKKHLKKALKISVECDVPIYRGLAGKPQSFGAGMSCGEFNIGKGENRVIGLARLEKGVEAVNRVVGIPHFQQQKRRTANLSRWGYVSGSFAV
ncbi:MAG: hypothetical protein ACTSP1_05990 [Candidatus Freyarchaeota archaeon]